MNRQFIQQGCGKRTVDRDFLLLLEHMQINHVDKSFTLKRKQKYVILPLPRALPSSRVKLNTYSWYQLSLGWGVQTPILLCRKDVGLTCQAKTNLSSNALIYLILPTFAFFLPWKGTSAVLTLLLACEVCSTK